MKALELKIPPVALVFIIAALMWLIAQAVPGGTVAFPGTRFCALALSAIGVTISLLGVLEFRSAGTTVDPRVPDQSESLVVKGVYRLSRNPMYVGFLLVLCGWGVFLVSVPAIVLLPLFVLYMNRFQIEPEERHMQNKFGESFRRYRQEVRRWI